MHRCNQMPTFTKLTNYVAYNTYGDIPWLSNPRLTESFSGKTDCAVGRRQGRHVPGKQ